MAIRAPRWKTQACPRTAFRTASGSLRSPRWTSIASRTLLGRRSSLPPVVSTVVADQGANLMPFADEELHQVAADEAPRPRDQHRLAHRRSLARDAAENWINPGEAHRTSFPNRDNGNRRFDPSRSLRPTIVPRSRFVNLKRTDWPKPLKLNVVLRRYDIPSRGKTARIARSGDFLFFR